MARKNLMLIASILCCSMMAFAGATQLSASSTVKGYQGIDGEEVFVLEVDKSSKAVVLVRGIGGQWEGKFLLADFIRQRGSSDNYTLKVKHEGSEWNLFIRHGDSFDVFTPEKPKGTRLISSINVKNKMEIPSANQFLENYEKNKK